MGTGLAYAAHNSNIQATWIALDEEAQKDFRLQPAEDLIIPATRSYNPRMPATLGFGGVEIQDHSSPTHRTRIR